MNTEKVNRVEIIDLTKPVDNGGGRVYAKQEDNIKVELRLQDDERTLKVFIKLQ